MQYRGRFGWFSLAHEAGLGLAPPVAPPRDAMTASGGTRVHRRDLLGGLIHEYHGRRHDDRELLCLSGPPVRCLSDFRDGGEPSRSSAPTAAT